MIRWQRYLTKRNTLPVYRYWADQSIAVPIDVSPGIMTESCWILISLLWRTIRSNPDLPNFRRARNHLVNTLWILWKTIPRTLNEIAFLQYCLTEIQDDMHPKVMCTYRMLKNKPEKQNFDNKIGTTSCTNIYFYDRHTILQNCLWHQPLPNSEMSKYVVSQRSTGVLWGSLPGRN